MDKPAERFTSGAAELRRWHPDDLDTLVRVVEESLDHLRPWMPWAAGQDRAQSAGFLARCEEEWETGQAFNYAVTTAGSVIGSCGLMRRIGPGGLEAGYWLHPGWTGRGLATMTAAGLVDQAFRLPGTGRVEIHHDAANTASGAVARRLGFTEAERRPAPDGPEAPGEVGIGVVWRVTAAEWVARGS
ncbi:acetyltransferase [Streptomyces sp. NRRL F-4489]|uniref:GNAT family N-acetyltransferase n=1 Tax=Streptomyces sp. NRRL F-4489 TaxID=1609095 RepID=UPI00074AEB07|nr:GNAT family N-acetyltransferase [Streptomyces sp. NRRL F-4489]KUL38713.1 acetyltransferase [Streptomyces sp. NRRL F-4489]